MSGLLSPPVSALEVEALAGIDWALNGVSPGDQLVAMTQAMETSPIDDIAMVTVKNATAAP